MAVAHRNTATTVNPTNGTSVNADLNLPTSVADDLLIAHIFLQVVSVGPLTLSSGPSGWTRQAQGDDAFAIGYEIWTKKSAAESGTARWITPHTDDYIDGTISAYSGVDTTTPLDVTPVITLPSGIGATQLSPSLTTVTADAWLLCGFCADSARTTVTAPGSMTQRANVNSGLATADEAIPTAGATGTRTWSVSPSVTAFTSSMALRPGASAIPAPHTADIFHYDETNP